MGIDAGPRRTQSSLYRNMTDLESVGLVQRVIGADDLTELASSDLELSSRPGTVPIRMVGVEGSVAVAHGADRTLGRHYVAVINVSQAIPSPAKEGPPQ